MSLEAIGIFEFDHKQGFINIAEVPNDYHVDAVLKNCPAEVLSRSSPASGPHTMKISEDKEVITERSVIFNSVYNRNCFSFLVIMILARGGRHSTMAFKRVLMGLMRRLLIAEDECKYLSRHENKKSRLVQLLTNIKESLNQGLLLVLDGEIGLKMNLCLEESIPFIDPNSIQLDFIPEYHEKDIFPDEQYERLMNDLTFSKVLPIIDGRRNISMISESSNVNIELIKFVISDIMALGIIKRIGDD